MHRFNKDHILIKNLYLVEGYTAQKLSKSFHVRVFISEVFRSC